MKKILAALLLVVIPASANAADLPQRFYVTGSGFGHGVGLSQMGARGLALEGKSAPEILNYFFPGTTLSNDIPLGDIKVNIAHATTYVTLSNSTGTITLNRPDGTTATTIAVGSTLKFAAVTKVISPTVATPKQKSIVIPALSGWNVTWDTGSVVTVNNGGATTKLSYGQVNLKSVANKIELTATMRLNDQYVYGISEMSSSWPDAAIQSQAIASRTYGLSRMGSIRKECDCNIYNTKFDQNYVGFSKESEAKYGALWKAAVDATSGQVLTYQGRAINVYFSSSTGGTTQKAADVWGTDFPYLTNVPDPWSLDVVLNPAYAHWLRVISQKDMAKAFGLPDVVSVRIDSRTVSNSALSLTATSSMGTTAQLLVGVFKTKLLIPASWFDITN
ncbi:MAG: SpoIID/LytB domain-containing protein [Actinomycetes bacterium]